MNNEEQQFLNDLDKRLWNAADRLRSNVNPSDYMHVVLPTVGTCPSGTQPVYRLFNNRPDANHRYTIDKAVRDQMVAQGWIAEGDGADAVAMCAPTT